MMSRVRVAQMSQAMEMLSEYKNVVVAGDFNWNDATDNDLGSLVATENFEDVWTVYVFFSELRYFQKKS